LRTAVALLVTLAFVTAIISLVGISAAVFNNAFTKVSQKQFIIQSNIFFRDIKTILKTNLGDINNSDELYFLVTIPFGINDTENDISVDIGFVSNSTKVNVNKMVESNQTIVPIYSQALDNLMISYNVSDRAFLSALIADTVDSDKEERIFGSEIALENRFFNDGGIVDMVHFEKILDHYKKVREDPSVDSIPWDKIFSFTNGEIDFNYVTSEAFSFMISTQTLASSKPFADFGKKKKIYTSFEELRLGTEEQESLEKFGVVFFSPSVTCNAKMKIGNQQGTLSFAYNLKTKEASNLEFASFD
jgi:hypothetical protein